MGKPGAFLEHDRATHALRPVDERVRDFLMQENPAAARAIADRLDWAAVMGALTLPALVAATVLAFSRPS